MKRVFRVLFITAVAFLLASCKKEVTTSNVNGSVIWSVTFDSNGGLLNEADKITAENEAKIECPTNPVKEGYTFVGWFLNDQKWDFNLNTVDSDITLVAHYEINEYKLTIKKYNGIEDTVITFTYDSLIKIENPIREGYDFYGYSEKIPSRMPSHDVTVETIWNIKKYKINLYFDNEKLYKTIEEPKGTIIDKSLIGTPVKDGYRFIEWDTAIPSVMPDHNVNIYAIYEQTRFCLTVKYNDGETPDLTIAQDGGTSIDDIYIPEREYQILDESFYTDFPKIMPYEDSVFEIKWKNKSYKLTYFCGEEEHIEYIEADTVLNLEDPVRVGYDFIGWDSEIPERMPFENVVLSVLWERKYYTLTVDLDNGEELITETYRYDDPITFVIDPVKDGYGFNGWSEEIPTSMPANDLLIKAIWIANSYNLHISYSSDECIDIDLNLEYGEEINLTLNPIKTGYEFYDWSEEIPTSMPKNDLFIYAIWTPIYKNVELVFDNGMENEIVESLDHHKISKIDDPVKEHYSFVGWYYNDAIWDFDEIITEDIKLVAKWEPLKYTITVEYNDGVNNPDTYTFDYGSTVSIENPTRKGYTFLHWDKEVPTKMIGEDIIIKPVWKHNLYTLTFNTYKDNKEYEDKLSYYYGDLIKVSTIHERYGYMFERWDKTIPLSMPDYDLTINALWSTTLYYQIDEETKTCSVTGYKGDTFYILSEYNGYPVTNIKYRAFENIQSLTKIVIPDSIKYIGDHAFSECHYIEEVIIGNSVEVIAEETFARCDHLSKVTFGENVKVIEKYAFVCCIDLKYATLPNGIEKISTDAFFGCDLLNYNSYDEALYLGSENNPYIILMDTVDLKKDSYTIHENCRVIGDHAFSKSIIKNVVIPSNVTDIGEYAFGRCEYLETVVIRGKIEIIRKGTFFNTYGLKNIYIPSSVKEIEEHAFRYENKSSCFYTLEIDSIDWIFNIKTSSDYGSPLRYAKEIVIDNKIVTTLEIPDGVTEISENLFRGCGAFSYVVIPNTVSHIGKYGLYFDRKYNSCSVSYNGTVADFKKIIRDVNWISINYSNDTLITCLDGSVSAFEE